MGRSEIRERYKFKAVATWPPGLMYVCGPHDSVRGRWGYATVAVNSLSTTRQVRELARQRLEKLYGRRLSLATIRLVRFADDDTIAATIAVGNFLSSGRG